MKQRRITSYRPSPSHLLNRLLEQPDLLPAIRSLGPQQLGRIINRVGLESAGELVACATTAQLEAVFDEDLWHSEAPGAQERFDAGRFGLWLEIMGDMGEEALVRRVSQIDEDLLVLGLHEHILVINPEELLMELAQNNSDISGLEKALEGSLYEEFFGYQVIARRDEHWDAILALLVALDRHVHGRFVTILERCCAITDKELNDIDSLYDVLGGRDSLEEDVAAARETRRSAAGHVSPTAAAAFLELARTTPRETIINSSKPNPVARGYFKDMAPEPRPVSQPVPEATSGGSAGLLEALQAADIVDDSGGIAGLLAGPATGEVPRPSPLAAALMELNRADSEAFGRAMMRLGFCANVLVAGAGLRPVEAVRAAMAVTHLGLHYIDDAKQPLSAGQLTPERVRHYIAVSSLENIFSLGWHVLQRDVVIPAATVLLTLLDNTIAAATDPTAIPAMASAATALRRALKPGRPWEALPGPEILREFLDNDYAAAFEGLISRCPMLQGSLSGNEEPQYIEEPAQIRRSRTWWESL